MRKPTRHFFAIIFAMSVANTTSIEVDECILPFQGNHGNYSVYCYYEATHYYIIINCSGKVLDNLLGIRVTVHKFSKVKFIDCTFSESVNIRDSLLSVGANGYNQITFEFFRKIPNRFNLQNLSILQLHLRQSNINELSYDLFYDLLNLHVLEIKRTKITHIPRDFFNDWAEQITELLLTDNKLKRIGQSDFTRLVNLENLDLTLNEINEIESGAFDNLAHLVSLNLASNQFHTLPPGIFNRLFGLTKFYLTPHMLDGRIRDGSRDYRDLFMYQMKKLSADTFKGMHELEVIEFEGHDLESFPLALFDDNERLLSLTINRNGLRFLPAGVFKRLKNLRYLYMEENRLTTLMPEVFIGLDSLKYLYASKNNLTRLDANFLKYLKSVTDIDLSYNRLARFRYEDENKLEYDNASLLINMCKNRRFQHVLHLNLSSNNFTEFDVIIHLMDGCFNAISEMSRDYESLHTEFVDEMQFSKTVDLSNNHISKINLTEISSRITKLDKFNINNTKIGYVKLYLNNISLKCDCYLMDFIRYLNGSNHQPLKKYWVMFSRRETNSDEEFTCSTPRELKNRDVRKINLEEFHCQLHTSQVDDACNRICACREYPGKQVLSVDCSFKKLKQLPKIINSVRNWSIELNMSGNALQRTPSLNHSYLLNITRLDLSSNRISDVTLGLFSPILRVLKLHNNSIPQLDSDILQYLARDNPLRSLTIHDNKWICNCKTHKILQRSNITKLSNYNFKEVLCHGTNRKLYEVTVSELCENTTILIVSASAMIAIFGVVIGSLAALYCKYQKQIKIWLYSKQLCLWFVTEDELDKEKKYDAFISFSHKDEDFVEKEIVAKLEAGHKPYKLCLHYRDWLAGEWIPLQISRSVADSRRTIIILTTNFFESVWGLMEFKVAHTQALEEGRARLIIILYGEIGNLDNLDQELKDYLRLNTYIEWGDPWFWQKLMYALPHNG